MKKKIIIISAIAIVVIAAIIGSIFLLGSLFKDDSGKKPSDGSSEGSSITASADEGNGDTASSDKTDSADKNSASSEKAELSVGKVSGKKGKIVKVPVEISNNPGFMASLLSFKYDNTAIKYVGYEKGNVLTDYEFADKDGVLKFLGLENKDVNKNGLLFNLKFEILKDGADANIELVVEDIVNYDEQSVAATITSGKISEK